MCNGNLFVVEKNSTFSRIKILASQAVRSCLSYDPLKLDFIAFKTNIISIRKYIVDTDIVNDVTFSPKSVITRVVIRFL